MKKITFLMKPQWIEEAVELLREEGVLHVSHSKVPAGEGVVALESKIQSFEQAIAIIERVKREEASDTFRDDEVEALVGRIVDCNEEARQLAEELEDLENEYREAAIWGDFDCRELEALERAGIKIALFSCPQESLKMLPARVSWQEINRMDGICYVAAFYKDEALEIPFREIRIPGRSFRETGKIIDQKKERRQSLEDELKGLSGSLPLLKRCLEVLKGTLEFERVCAGRGEEEGIAWVKGFIPHDRLEPMKSLASKERWGLIVEEPHEEDDVPTLIRHSRLSALFQPVMSFIGITPGYFEYDTNAVFIIFFSLFFAMIVGDAGYGLILLVATLSLRMLKPSLPGNMEMLLYLLSLSTMVWGMVTGNWFGMSGAGAPFLNSMIIPGLDSFNAASSAVVMELCFFVALMHLSVAHAWKGILFWPSLRILGEVGWIVMLSGIYLLVKGLILKSASIHIALNLILSGFVMIILFGKQEGDGFIKGLARGLKSLPVTALDGLGGISNVVSYLRLFAVGMASKEVAAAFNKMAFETGFQSLDSVFFAVLILLFGHAVNMLLIAMSVIVHGIRLNILEYSGHMNIEWSGIPYKPFGLMPKVKKEGSPSKELMEV